MTTSNLIRVLALVALTACQTPSDDGTTVAITPAETIAALDLHSYSLACTGTGLVAMAILGVSEPSGTYQVYQPPGGGLVSVSGTTVTLTLTDVEANPQATVTSGSFNCALTFDGTPGVTVPLTAAPPTNASHDWDYL